MSPIEHPLIPSMAAAARAAGRICRSVQETLATSDAVTKGDRSPVTVADFAAQAVVSKRLRDSSPEIALVAEEDSSLLGAEDNVAVRLAVIDAVRLEWPGAGPEAICDAVDRGDAAGGAAGRFFVLDPIDGTKGFLRGDQYAVALGLLVDGVVEAGVLACPNLPGPGGGRGTLFLAARGEGAFQAPMDDESAIPERIRVSAETDPTRARFCESVEKAHSHRGRSGRVADAMGVAAEPVRVDSQCKYGLVARGDAELYLRIPRDDVYREKIWDHAAGLIVVEEAGGRVTDIHGNALDFRHGRKLTENRGVVGSNGPLHDTVLEALRTTD